MKFKPGDLTVINPKKCNDNLEALKYCNKILIVKRQFEEKDKNNRGYYTEFKNHFTGYFSARLTLVKSCKLLRVLYEI